MKARHCDTGPRVHEEWQAHLEFIRTSSGCQAESPLAHWLAAIAARARASNLRCHVAETSCKLSRRRGLNPFRCALGFAHGHVREGVGARWVLSAPMRDLIEGLAPPQAEPLIQMLEQHLGGPGDIGIGFDANHSSYRIYTNYKVGSEVLVDAHEWLAGHQAVNPKSYVAEDRATPVREFIDAAFEPEVAAAFLDLFQPWGAAYLKTNPAIDPTRVTAVNLRLRRFERVSRIAPMLEDLARVVLGGLDDEALREFQAWLDRNEPFEIGWSTLGLERDGAPSVTLYLRPSAGAGRLVPFAGTVSRPSTEQSASEPITKPLPDTSCPIADQWQQHLEFIATSTGEGRDGELLSLLEPIAGRLAEAQVRCYLAETSLKVTAGEAVQPARLCLFFDNRQVRHETAGRSCLHPAFVEAVRSLEPPELEAALEPLTRHLATPGDVAFGLNTMASRRLYQNYEVEGQLIARGFEWNVRTGAADRRYYRQLDDFSPVAWGLQASLGDLAAPFFTLFHPLTWAVAYARGPSEDNPQDISAYHIRLWQNVRIAQIASRLRELMEACLAPAGRVDAAHREALAGWFDRNADHELVWISPGVNDRGRVQLCVYVRPRLEPPPAAVSS